MLTLVNIYRVLFRKKDGTYSEWFDLLCSDDYVSKDHLCGSASKTLRVSRYVLNKALDGDDNSDMIQSAICEGMVGKAVYNIFNERGYVSYIKFYDPDEKKEAASSGDVPAAASSPDGVPD